MRLPAIAFALVLGHGSTALARPCPVDKSIGKATGVEGKDSRERMAFIRARIDAGGKHELRWALGWGIGLALVTVAQLALVPLEDPGERPVLYIGALQSAIGAGSRALFIPRSTIERRRMRRNPPDPDDCVALAAAERALARSARTNHHGKALWQHFLSLGVNAGMGLLLGLAFKKPVEGSRLAAIGMITGQVMIVTQPTTMIRSLDSYRMGRIATPQRISPRPFMLAGGGGVMIGGSI
jgi:hypothetical protein